MDFALRKFVKDGLLKGVGKQPEYKIMQMAAEWLDKGVLEISDMEEIQNALNTGDVTRENGGVI